MLINGEGMENPVKKRGRPPKNPAIGTRTTAERQREYRERQRASLATRESHEWTRRECLEALSGTYRENDAIGKAAWLQLGKLLGYCDAAN